MTVGGFDPRDFGVIVGTGLTSGQRQTNRANLQSALTAATSNRTVLRLPAGTIEVEMTAANPNLSLADDCVIVGAGPSESIIKCFPDTQLNPQACFSVAADKNVLFRNFQINGPTGNPPTLFSSQAITITPQTTSKVVIACQDLWVRGKFADVINWQGGVGAGEGLLIVRDCKFDFYTTAIDYYRSDGGGRRFVHIENTDFGDGVASGETTFPQGHGVYIHPTIIGGVYNCRFWKLTGGPLTQYACHFNTDTTTEGHLSNLTVEDCWFGPQVPNAIYLSIGTDAAEKPNLKVRGCRFHMDVAAMQGVFIARGNADIGPGNWFDSSGTTNIMDAVGSGDKSNRIRVFNNTFGKRTRCICASTATASPRAVFEFSNNTWLLGGAAAETLGQAFLMQADHIAYFKGDTIRGGIGTDEARVGIEVAAGRVYLNGVTFEGAWKTGTAAFEISGGTEIVADNCVFDTSGAGRAITQTTVNNVLRGSNNLFRSTAATGLPDIPDTLRARLEFRNALDTATIASATTITVDPNFNKVHVSLGTSPIQDIQFPQHAQTKRAWAGIYTFIADGAWATNEAGNIRGNTATKTPNRAYSFLRDPNTDLWYEVP